MYSVAEHDPTAKSIQRHNGCLADEGKMPARARGGKGGRGGGGEGDPGLRISVISEGCDPRRREEGGDTSNAAAFVEQERFLLDRGGSIALSICFDGDDDVDYCQDGELIDFHGLQFVEEIIGDKREGERRNRSETNDDPQRCEPSTRVSAMEEVYGGSKVCTDDCCYDGSGPEGESCLTEELLDSEDCHDDGAQRWQLHRVVEGEQQEDSKFERPRDQAAPTTEPLEYDCGKNGGVLKEGPGSASSPPLCHRCRCFIQPEQEDAARIEGAREANVSATEAAAAASVKINTLTLQNEQLTKYCVYLLKYVSKATIGAIM
eukprot:GHVU01121950.1.p1 GENE.GHVU01121950.1~~GHVU01121950.1.p1  ORF type:complete len:319 (+),score=71.46 GHVU01121950.1:954-1910(+)